MEGITVNEKSCSRRSFLKAGVVAGIAAGAASLGNAPVALGDEKSGAAARFTEEQLEMIGKPHPGTAVSYEPIEGTEPIEPEGAPESWDYECDVVVVGLGGGGLLASAMCAEAGLSVWGIDKLETVGGNTKESSVFACPGGARMQEAVGYASPYDPEEQALQYLEADLEADLQIARVYARNYPKAADWMQDHGVPWEFSSAHGGFPGVLAWEGSVEGGFFPRAMEPVCNQIHKAGLEAGAQYALSTQVVNLVKEGDSIVGVKTVDINDSVAYFRADKGVILTAGGIEASPQMLQKYCPTIYAGSVGTYNVPVGTGEVIRMGLGAGAGMTGFDRAEGFDGGIDAYFDGLRPWSHYLYSGDNQLSRQPWLSIDRTGNRHVYFPFSTLGYQTGSHTWTLTEGATPQANVEAAKPGGRSYVIFDDDYEANVPKFNQGGCRKIITPDMPNIDRMPEWLAPHDWREGVAKALEDGVIKKADTLEELADLLGLEQDIVLSAVENWNQMCEQGEDPEYYYDPAYLVPIKKAPFYGIKIGRQVSKTHAGLEVNSKFQVMATNGKPIGGLYAGCHTNGVSGEVARGNAGSWTGGYCCAESLIASLQE